MNRFPVQIMIDLGKFMASFVSNRIPQVCNRFSDTISQDFGGQPLL